MALDEKQRALLAAIKAAARKEGIGPLCKRINMHRSTMAAVLSDTSNEGSLLIALDRFSKAKPAA